MTPTKLKSILKAYDSFSEELYVKLVEEFELEVKPLEERRLAFIETLKPHLAEFGRDMMNAFAEYWLEKATNGKKFRFEKEKSWDITRRLYAWQERSKKFSIVGMLQRNNK